MTLSQMPLTLFQMPLTLSQMTLAWRRLRETLQRTQRLWPWWLLVARAVGPGQEWARGRRGRQTLAVVAPATWESVTKRLAHWASQPRWAVVAGVLPTPGAAWPWHQARLSGRTVPVTAMWAALRQPSPVALPQWAHQQAHGPPYRVALAQAVQLGWPFCPLVPVLRQPRQPCQGWRGSGRQATGSLRIWPVCQAQTACIVTSAGRRINGLRQHAAEVFKVGVQAGVFEHGGP